MNYYLSEKNCRLLKEWGCKELTTEIWNNGNFSHYGIDIIDIICDGEMNEKFFGYNPWEQRHEIVDLLSGGEKEEAEEYFMENTVFNPINK